MISGFRRTWKLKLDLHTKIWLIIWMIVASVVFFAFYFSRRFIGYFVEFDVLVNSMNVISYVIAIGIPVFFLSGIVFGTSAARRDIITLQKTGKKTRDIFIRYLFKVYALILIFSSVMSVALFLEPLLLGLGIIAPTGTGFLIYLPSVLVATSVVSLIYATFGILLVTLTDDLIISTTMGSVFAIGVQIVVWSSAFRGIHLLGPQNFICLFAAHISGYNPPTDTSFTHYFGIDLSLTGILSILVFVGIVVFVGFIASFKIFQHNISTWSTRQEYSESLEEWDSKPERNENYEKNKRGLKMRRRVIVVFILCSLILMSVRTDSYIITAIEENTIYFHQSPHGGEWIELGELYIFSCNVQPPAYGQENYLHSWCSVENWGNSPEQIIFYHAMLKMSSSDFQSLNEIEQRSLLINTTMTESEGGFSHVAYLIPDYGSYIFAMKAIASANESLSGFFYCTINLYQSPT